MLTFWGHRVHWCVAVVKLEPATEINNERLRVRLCLWVFADCFKMRLRAL